MSGPSPISNAVQSVFNEANKAAVPERSIPRAIICFFGF